MTTPRPAAHDPRPRLLAPITAAVLAAAALVAGSSRAAGIDIHAGADASDVGLPVYPGAVKRPEDDGGGGDDLSFGLWGSAFGVKIATVAYRSRDGVDDVSAFYRDALHRFGPVLDCSAGVPRAPARPASGAKGLDCADDHPAPGVRLYKAGSAQDLHLVEIQPRPHGASLRLTRVQTRGLD